MIGLTISSISMDNLSSSRRSWNMSRIKSTNTSPEFIVRKLIWSLGYRYRLHYKKLPGKPDLFFTKKKLAIFINGCFWHQHAGCKRNFMPKSNQTYWKKKLTNNVNRQRDQMEKLKVMGVQSEIIWECETKDINKIVLKIKNIFLRT